MLPSPVTTALLVILKLLESATMAYHSGKNHNVLWPDATMWELRWADFSTNGIWKFSTYLTFQLRYVLHPAILLWNVYILRAWKPPYTFLKVPTYNASNSISLSDNKPHKEPSFRQQQQSALQEFVTFQVSCWSEHSQIHATKTLARVITSQLGRIVNTQLPHFSLT